MEFKIIKDTDEEFVLRLDAGKLRVNYIMSAFLLAFPSVMVIAAFVSAAMDRTASEMDMSIAFAIIAFGFFCIIDWKLISMNLKPIRLIVIDVVNRALKIKTLLPRACSTYRLNDIEHFTIILDKRLKGIIDQYQPMRLELLLRSGQMIPVFESMQRFQETLETVVQAIDAAMHKEIPYKAAQP